jgi:L-asparaginase II
MAPTADSLSPLPDTVELARLLRGGVVESVHRGSAVVLAPDGEVVAEYGDTTAPMLPRSTLKFAQAVAVARSGLVLGGAQAVLSAASHTGTSRHVEVVRAMLADGGLDESQLGCPPDWPADSEARRAASGPLRVTMNCSGKHAAFLRAAALNGWDLDGYLDPGHPLQQLILQTVEELAGEPVSATTVDGCGAPLFALGLRGLARTVAEVGAGRASGSAHLAPAIKGDSWGLDRPAVARVIDELGVIAKNGAEGVFVAATVDGAAVAVKVADGSSRAALPAGLTALARAGFVDTAVSDRLVRELSEKVLGAGEPVGELRVTL